MRLVLAVLVMLAITGCAQVRLAALPTDEERCVGGGGVFHAGLCEYCR